MIGLNVGVIGAGRSGLAAARLLKKLGANVFLSDSGKRPAHFPKEISAEFAKHSSRLLNSDVIVRSPGVPSHLLVLRRAVRSKIPIWSELELGYRNLSSLILVAITGTNGKTTTTTLVGELLKASKKRTWVGGNIGTPLSDLVGSAKSNDQVVVEVSSYQLEDIETFHPNISAILNITPDHLEHHGTMRAYAGAKARIFENQTAQDVCVMNADDPYCRQLAKRCKARIFWFSRKRRLKQGIYYKSHPHPITEGRVRVGGDILIHWGKMRVRWKLQTNLPGSHNVENILASVAIAMAAGVSQNAIRRVLSTFRGVEHRLEWVKTIRGVRYINDSKATNVDSTRVALDSFEEPLVLIMGGEGKGSPYAPLKAAIASKVKRLLLIGEDAPRIAKELKGVAPIEHLKTMTRAVRRAPQVTKAGDVVLLSPACASFDQYNNYEERGRDFKSLVRRLK